MYTETTARGKNKLAHDLTIQVRSTVLDILLDIRYFCCKKDQ